MASETVPPLSSGAHELLAETDGQGRIRSCSASLVAFVEAGGPDQLVGLTFDELAVTGPRRTLLRAIRDAADSGADVGPVDLWIPVGSGRVRIGRFWVRSSGSDTLEVRGVDLASLDRQVRRAAVHGLVLGWMSTGLHGDQVLRHLVQLVEWSLPGTTCAVAVLEDDVGCRVVSPATMPRELVSLVQLPASDRLSTRETPTAIASETGATRQWRVRIDDVGGSRLGVLTVFSGADLALDGEDLHFLRQVSDVAAASISRDRGEKETLHNALHDPLTGLPNRRQLIDRIDHAIEASRGFDTGVAVLMVDIDEFKVANDSLSHAAGDEVLVHVARRLEVIAKPGEVVGRFGGDEFLTVTPVADAAAALEVGERIRSDLDGAIRVGDSYVRTSVSVGVAIGGETDDARTLLRDADAALHRAKAAGRNRVVLFDQALRNQVVERVETETALRRGLARKELEVHYQPIVQLDPVRAIGAEALVRWRRDGVTLLGPDLFVPAAASGGLIEQLGAEVLQEAARLTATLRADRHPDLVMSVNISPHELNRRLVPNLRAILRDAGLPADALCIEITESALVWEGAERVIFELATLGVGIAIDDFGTGYSSLNHLRRFPMATALKIDGTFVADLQGPTPSGQAIVSAAISLGHSLGMKVTAEGVETLGQLRLLREMACECVQGYLLGQAVPSDDLADVLDEVVGRVPSH